MLKRQRSFFGERAKKLDQEERIAGGPLVNQL
jgi:hypothetical protein